MNEEQYDLLMERLDLIEFRQELLFGNTDSDRLMFESGITRGQQGKLFDLMDEFRNRIYAGEKCRSADFESRVYEIVPARNGDYHFCESFALTLFDEGRWTEVFSQIYGDNSKYADRVNGLRKQQKKK